MQVFDYETPEGSERPTQLRRYCIRVIIAGLGYCAVLSICILLGISYADDPPGSTPVLDTFLTIVDFPMLTFFYKVFGGGIDIIILLGVCNAAIWGVTFERIWRYGWWVTTQVLDRP